MAYADYEYYIAEYHGNAVPEADFPRAAERASEYIDYITQGQAAAAAARPPVKRCCCALAECYGVMEKAKAAATADERELKSQTLDGWTKTYQTTGEAAKEYQSRLYATAVQYLATTGLLYRGKRRPCSHTL